MPTLLVFAGEAGQDRLAERLPPLVRELDGSPVRADCPHHFIDRDVALRAAGGIGLAAQAKEVGVRAAPVAVGQGDTKASPAAGAVEHTLEVVRSLLAFIFAQVAGVEQRLHAVKGRVVNERLVVTTVLQTTELHPARVVTIAQQPLHGLAVNRPLGEAPVGGQAEALRIGVGGERRQRVDPAVVALETLGDNWPERGMDAHVADVLAERHDLNAHVFITHRHFAGRAAVLHLLAHTFFGFLAQIGRIPLGDVGHDTVNQLAGWAVVNVLGTRHQPYAVFGKHQVNLHVVLAVAGQPIELVDEDVLDVGVVLDTGQHRLEGRAGSSPGALAPINVLVNELHAHLSRFALTVVTLGLDGETVLVVTGVGLVHRRDAEVSHTVALAVDRRALRFGGSTPRRHR